MSQTRENVVVMQRSKGFGRCITLKDVGEPERDREKREMEIGMEMEMEMEGRERENKGRGDHAVMIH